MARKIAVIGSGASGLAGKCCLDEGLQPVCFEKGTDIGGLWNFKEEALPGFASIYRSTVINTSKEMMCYSDFPIPKEYPNFMHHSLVKKYFKMYADNFDLMTHIRPSDYITMMDDVAVEIGVKPDFRSLLFSDPRLALQCYFGPCTPYQYRLMGPGAWKGAKEAIQTQMHRVKYPTKTRATPEDEDTGITRILKVLVVLVVILAFLWNLL